MIHLSTNNLEFIDAEHGLKHSEFMQDASHIQTYLDKIEARGQDFYRAIDDTEVPAAIETFAASIQGKYSHIVLLGIGGSALGTLCLQQSLTHLFISELPASPHPRLHVLDNVDPVLIRELEDVIDLPRTLFIVVTKSGATPETLAQYFYFRGQVEAARLDHASHFIFVTDPEKGLLRKIANEEGVTAFDIPPGVGGRFSVLTAVGLLPAALIGIDIRALLQGAREMRDRFLSTKFEHNMAFQIAAIQYLLGTKGKTTHVLMPYSQKLIRFADWYRQLLAESIGKAINDNGETVNVGLTPVSALGVTDQHSQSQLYNEGPNDKLFIFLTVQDFGTDMEIPPLYGTDPSVDYLQNATFARLMHLEMQGTIDSLNTNHRPNITIQIGRVDAWHLGSLFMLMEGATAFLGEYFGINAFDQPGVELSKQITKKLLMERK